MEARENGRWTGPAGRGTGRGMGRLISAIALSRAPVLAFMAMGLGFGGFSAMVPVLKGRLGLADGAFGLALMCSAAGLMAALWVAPRLEAGLGRRALPLAAGGMGVAFLLPFLVGGQGAVALAGLAVAIAVLGLGSGTTDVLMNTRVSELEAAHGRSLMNAAHGMFSVAYIFGAVWAALVREAGWPALAVPCLAAVAALGAVRWMAGPKAVRAAEAPGAAPVRLGGAVIWGGLIVLMAFLVESATEGWSALHIERTLGGRAAEGALGPAMLGLSMAVGRLGGQVLADRVGERWMIALACPLAGVGLVLAAAAATPAQALAGFGLAGLGASVVAPMALALIGRRVAPAQRTRAIAVASVTGFMAFLVGPSLIGLLSEAVGLRWALGAIALPVALTPLLLAGLRERRPAATRQSV